MFLSTGSSRQPPVRVLDRITSEFIPLRKISFSPSPPWGRGGRGMRGSVAKCGATLHTRIPSSTANSRSETELKLRASVTSHPPFAALTHLTKIPIHPPPPIKRLKLLPHQLCVGEAMTSRLKPDPPLVTSIYQPQPHPTGHGPHLSFSREKHRHYPKPPPFSEPPVDPSVQIGKKSFRRNKLANSITTQTQPSIQRSRPWG